jgi:hypothetical protein
MDTSVYALLRQSLAATSTRKDRLLSGPFATLWIYTCVGMDTSVHALLRQSLAATSTRKDRLLRIIEIAKPAVGMTMQLQL